MTDESPGRRPLRRGLRLLQVVAGQDPGLGPAGPPARRRDPERGGRAPARRAEPGGAARLLAPGRQGREALLGRRRRRAAGAAASRPDARWPRSSGPSRASPSAPTVRRRPPRPLGAAASDRRELRAGAGEQDVRPGLGLPGDRGRRLLRPGRGRGRPDVAAHRPAARGSPPAVVGDRPRERRRPRPARAAGLDRRGVGARADRAGAPSRSCSARRGRGGCGSSAVLAASGASLAVSVAAPLLLSRDVYTYAAYGRIQAVYHREPVLAHRCRRSAHDPFVAVSSAQWLHTHSVYGPLFTLVSAGIARAWAGSAGATILAFKLLAGLAVAAATGFAALAAHADPAGAGGARGRARRPQPRARRAHGRRRPRRRADRRPARGGAGDRRHPSAGAVGASARPSPSC